ncbi:hypothetical protein JD844_006502 [Phrynosoma platyrhinos]|uniref:Lipase n=1 Tax=Phrynosoma platyrhinos TaxID=52577 RepID=A0ABQ7T252_PHRPL|nr:hypothetical protein JD844_006502 [Phrynosoma platyrhinos]
MCGHDSVKTCLETEICNYSRSFLLFISHRLKMWTFIITVCLCQGIFSLKTFRTSEVPPADFTINPESFLNVTEIISYHGYPSEEYQVVTEDGYILTIVRIPYGRYNDSNKGPRPAVLLYHGFLGDAAHWISNQPSNSLGFILADAGYDVWLGNSRGNTYSSRHKSLKASEEKFWEFSFHEMGYYDIPAVVDFILKKSWHQQLYYVGHSEGSSVVVTNFKYYAFQMVLGNRGLLHYTACERRLVPMFCSHQPKFCANIFFFVSGCDRPNLNMVSGILLLGRIKGTCVQVQQIYNESRKQTLSLEAESRIDMYSAHFPAGTSVQNGLHWCQVYNGKLFRAYDYGSKEKNKAKYNQTTPPIYKIEEIKIPIAIWTGGKDLIVDQRDAAMLVSRISNVIYKKCIPEWVHLDFIWGLDATKRMYMDIIEIMKYP